MSTVRAVVQDILTLDPEVVTLISVIVLCFLAIIITLCAIIAKMSSNNKTLHKIIRYDNSIINSRNTENIMYAESLTYLMKLVYYLTTCDTETAQLVLANISSNLYILDFEGLKDNPYASIYSVELLQSIVKDPNIEDVYAFAKRMFDDIDDSCDDDMRDAYTKFIERVDKLCTTLDSLHEETEDARAACDSDKLVIHTIAEHNNEMNEPTDNDCECLIETTERYKLAIAQ